MSCRGRGGLIVTIGKLPAKFFPRIISELWNVVEIFRGLVWIIGQSAYLCSPKSREGGAQKSIIFKSENVDR